MHGEAHCVLWSITKYVSGVGHQLLDLPGGFWEGAASKGAAQVQSCVPCSLCGQVAAHAQCMPAVPHSGALMSSHLQAVTGLHSMVCLCKWLGGALQFGEIFPVLLGSSVVAIVPPREWVCCLQCNWRVAGKVAVQMQSTYGYKVKGHAQQDCVCVSQTCCVHVKLLVSLKCVLSQSLRAHSARSGSTSPQIIL